MQYPIGFLAALALACALSACVPSVAEPPVGTAYVELSNGGSLFGSSSMKIYADDTIVTQSSDPRDKAPKVSRAKGPEGAYSRVAALLRAEGPKVAAQLRRSGPAEACLDYGTDTILAEPPIGRFESVSGACPSPIFDAFQSRVRMAIAGS